MNWLVCIGFAARCLPRWCWDGAPLKEAALLALFAGMFTFRWFARCLASFDGRMAAAVQSDIAYSLLLMGWLSILASSHQVEFQSMGSRDAYCCRRWLACALRA